MDKNCPIIPFKPEQSIRLSNPMICFRSILVLNRIIKTGLILVLLLLAFNCSSPQSTFLQPNKQPYQLQTIMNLEGDNIYLSDLDGNGFTEMIIIKNSLAPTQSGSCIILATFEGKVIEQVNYAGRIIEEVFALDCNGDGILELMVPYVRNDSLFVSGVSHRGEKLFHFFLIDGKPRIEDGGRFDWDPQVRGFHVQDLNNDGAKELVTVVSTGYARLPRGILVHSLRDGKLIGKSIVGSPPRDNFLDDFDGDGKLEVLCFATSPNNGANAGGFDDQHSYLIVFALNPAPEVVRSKEVCKKYSYYRLLYEDIDGNSNRELIAWTEIYSEQSANSRIAILDPSTFKELKTRSFNGTLNGVVITNLGHDTRQEIIAIRSQKEIIVLNSNFDQLKSRRYSFNFDHIKALPDADNDGIPDLIVGNEQGEFLLDTELRIKASLPNAQFIGVVRRGENLSPQIVLKTGDHLVLVQLTKNPFYLVKRYYSSVLYFITGGLLVLLLSNIFKMRSQNRLLRQVHSMTFDSDSRGFLLFDSQQKIKLINSALQKWFGIAELEKSKNRHLTDLFSCFPELIAFFNDSIHHAMLRHEKSFSLKIGGQKRTLQLVLDPLPIKKRRPLWLATFVDRSADDEKLQAKTWCKMAQKTAHDIKNPLTTIRLTLERLQMFQQGQSPPAAEKFDLYVKRIIERVESLRRISKNFMKFVNVDALNPVNTNLNEFLSETTNTIQAGLPPDIQMTFQPGANLPITKIDQEAMQSVIENLVSNAINAMLEGGKITLSTQFLPGMTFPGAGSIAKNYVLIEVMDTGIGLSEADRDHLFEPDFTRTEGGNGLGLAYVKKTVDDHDGYIEVESEPGAGTAFCIYIPII